MERVNNKLFWIISIIFISIAIVYIDKMTVPSMLILLAGIILLPPVNKQIENILGSEAKREKYSIVKIILSIMFALIFIANIHTQITDKIADEIQTNTKISGTNSINQTEVDNTVGLIVNETNGKYAGERVNGKKQGKGKYEWNDGSVYIGEFSNDTISGKGKLTIPRQGNYEGEFVNGKRHGTGTYAFNNGDKYVGKWENDKMKGKGTYTFSNGDKYEGEFSNNKFNGTGTYTKGKNKYTGTWKDNEYKK